MKNFKYLLLISSMFSLGVSSVLAEKTAAKSSTTSASSSEAKSPSLKIAGFSIFEAIDAKQKQRQNGRGGDVNFVIGASDLYFTIAGKASSGLDYKYRVNFETIPGSGAYVNKNYLEFGGEFGTIQAGNNKGPEDTMQFGGLQMTNGAKTIDGALLGVYNFSSGVISGVNFVGETKYATKVVYYSPYVSGFQLGVALTPNTSRWGDDSRGNHRLGGHLKGNQSGIYPDKSKAPFGKNNVVVGLRYQQEHNKWTYGASVIGMHERTVLTPYSDLYRVPVHNANSYQLTANVGYGAWNLAGGFIDNRKSRLPKVAVGVPNAADAHLRETRYYLGNTHLGNAGKAWNVGTNYTHGAYQFGVAYHRTDRKTDATGKAKSDIVATTVDVLALPGLKFFGEFDILKTRTNANAMNVQQTYLNGKGQNDKAIGNNTGTVFVLGTKISF